MKIPFSLPVIDQDVIDEMNDTLINTGWLTSGPKVIALEKEIQKLTDTDTVICVNSWTSGAMLTLRWFGVGAGDEVIIPSYTYSATALAVLNMGATPVMVDVKDDFTIDPENIKKAITEKTKAIFPVDMAGWPCDYDSIMELVSSDEVKAKFNVQGKQQEKLNRILVMADAAHSIGAHSYGKPVGRLADITVFSLHSVKNITTGEGGAICLNLPESFDHTEEYTYLKALSLNGQNKSAFEKNQPGAWKYDIIDQGLKVNLPDICASVGLAQIKKYKSELLPERKSIFQYYDRFFKEKNWALLPPSINESKESSYHLYLLRISGISETQRDEMIHYISTNGVGVNVHYIPMPMLTLFKNLGYQIADYPNTYKLYANEISLPVYNNLSEVELKMVCAMVEEAYNKVVAK
ncbi:DegT/DnrJ/EryC1/StrS family aminotransferase [Ancylomarina euxinus]|uniref:DegT/DnrJ/EryC1/StrS family aminotransferase n=1 Tax=Ancylomarina euxinus TaxID=2283627 RepID=A0A425XWR2_9BACT|nr:DegT/DnrJ/EryC1/StrS family aminotransferase [Ancylomarina euxinus]MCZ4696338.1 DegT/DnrJ/EryC1/StrS family aminotransferase [Ancylomarina euxinus]MUP16761.1 aminotransferase class I/II-fold pyridoxal phosphate-dependent enzyme [Ancylomarina euxinus]RRG19081.1 DegT/DnrJ/EryC1/StrS family aminotransferase [Ancylomarina euxinus]